MTQRDTQPPAETLAIDHACACLKTIGETKHVQIKRDALETLLAALTRRAGGDAIPAGWRLVPVEPTREMVDEACLVNIEIYPTNIPSGLTAANEREARSIWSAMLAATPKPPADGDAGEWQRAAYASIAANKAATKLIDRMLASLGHMADGLADQKSSWANYARRLFTESQDTAHADRLAALALPAPVVEGDVVAACGRIQKWMDDEHRMLAPGEAGAGLSYDDVTTVLRAALSEGRSHG